MTYPGRHFGEDLYGLAHVGASRTICIIWQNAHRAGSALVKDRFRTTQNGRYRIFVDDLHYPDHDLDRDLLEVETLLVRKK